jgi:hypothetical protein
MRSPIRLAAAVFVLVAGSGVAAAQTSVAQHQMGVHAGMHAGAAIPTMPGQDASGAIQEIVQILDADPQTDWSKVDLEALRQHLIDMNEVTLRAAAAATPVDGGIEVAVTGSGRTLVAIQRMIPAWATTMQAHRGWRTQAAALPDGERLTVTASDPAEIRHIRGLGFIGLLVSGTHHQPHHLAMARGEPLHKMAPLTAR